MPRRAFGTPLSFWLGTLALALSLMALPGCGSAGKHLADKRSLATSPATSAVAKSPAASELVAIGAGLRGPPGLKATVYAQGPPTLATFDFAPDGRLWLTAAGLETHTQDGVYLVAKAGAPARRVVSGLNDPLGLDWYAGRLYVSSVGRVDAYWGFNGTRFTGHREILKGPLAEGENNLLVMAPDGRFLMGVSATCDHCDPTSKWDGAIVSFRPDGSDLRLYASRIRAPVGLALFPGTSDLLVTMNQQDNLGALTPGDTLGFVREGQQWGFPECHGQGGPACAGVPKPLAVLDKHAAVGGVAIVTGQLGPSIGTSALVAEWNVAKVQRVALTRTGSGFQGTVAPFLTGITHPLALTFASDRSLLVGDWATGRVYQVIARSN
jgi:glucose/arabinose dehydrogenase